MIKVDEAQTALEKAKIHWQAKEWQLTIESCAKALALDLKLAQAHKLMGDALQKTDKGKEAVGYYQQAISIKPDFVAVYLNLGSLYANQKQWQQAISYYQAALKIDPELLIVHEHLARILSLQQSEVSFNLEHFLHQGKMLKHQGKLEEALKQYIIAAEIASQNIDIYREIVDISQQLGMWQNAAKYCRLILQLSSPGICAEIPHDSKSSSTNQSQLLQQSQNNHKLTSADYLELAQNSVKEKKYKTAATYYHRAIERQPNLLEAYLGWGDLLDKLGSVEQAITFYLQALKQVEDNSEIYYRLGNLYRRKKKWSQAAICYQKAIQSTSNCTKAHHELAEVLGYLE